MEEIWKDIPGYEGKYQASSLGRIKSLDRSFETNLKSSNQYMSESKTVTRIHKVKGKIKKLSNGGHGYYVVNLGYRDLHVVHSLIIKTFIKKPNGVYITNHKNGIKTDNRIENLEWVTYTENLNHAFKTGLNKNIGENHCYSVLTEKDVMHIRDEYFYKDCKTEMIKKLAKGYSISISTIYDIILYRRWKHVR